MRMKWKFPAYFGGLVLAIAATAVSCSKDSTAPQQAATVAGNPHILQQKIQELQTEYGWMGRFHTEGLAYIHSKLLQSPRASSAEKCRLATHALEEFSKTFSKGPGSSGIGANILLDDMCDSSPQVSASRQLEIASDPRLLKPRHDVSPEAASLMSQIESVFDSDATLAATEATIYYLEGVAVETLSSEEAGAVVGVGSIAISSADYWDVNLDVWSDNDHLQEQYSRASAGPDQAASILAGPPKAPRYGLSPLGKKILKADVGTAITSLVTGWFLGAADLEVAALRATAASAIAGFWKT